MWPIGNAVVGGRRKSPLGVVMVLLDDVEGVHFDRSGRTVGVPSVGCQELLDALIGDSVGQMVDPDRALHAVGSVLGRGYGKGKLCAGLQPLQMVYVKLVGKAALCEVMFDP